MRATACSLFLVCLCSPSNAAEEEQTELDASNKQFITDSVNLLGDCGGFYEFMSDIYKVDGKPATSQQMHELANGAMMAASYLLYLEYHARGEKPKKLGEFSHYPQGRADTNKTRLTALLEQRDLDGIKSEQKRCLEAAPLQNEIVQQVRNESVGRP